MAVDTRNRRFSMIWIGVDLGRVHPDPDGSISSSADRVQLLPLYPGISLGLPTETGENSHRVFPHRPKWYRWRLLKRPGQ